MVSVEVQLVLALLGLVFVRHHQAMHYGIHHQAMDLKIRISIDGIVILVIIQAMVLVEWQGVDIVFSF